MEGISSDGTWIVKETLENLGKMEESEEDFDHSTSVEGQGCNFFHWQYETKSETEGRRLGGRTENREQENSGR